MHTNLHIIKDIISIYNFFIIKYNSTIEMHTHMCNNACVSASYNKRFQKSWKTKSSCK